MITHFLGDQEVAAYARDLAQRLSKLPVDQFPTVWCPIGRSGDKMVRALADKLPSELSDQVKVVELYFDKTNGQIDLGENAVASDVKGAAVLVIDSSVHSGKSMLAAMRFVKSAGAKQAIAYSLVVKRSSNFLPHYFGVIVGDHDRVLFQLEAIPNNRLFSGKYQPVGFFRRIDPMDAKRASTCLDTGVKSLNKISFGDLYYEHRVNGFDVIVIEDNERIAGFLKVKVNAHHGLLVDVVANDKDYRGCGLGGALMRYAETLGRASCCTHIDLWAIENQVGFYQRFDFLPLQDSIDTGDGEVYRHMRKKLLYHFELHDSEA